MKNLWPILAVGGLLALLLMKKSGPSGPALVITWAPGATTDIYDAEYPEDGSTRDVALATIGFPWRSLGTDGNTEWIEITAPSAAIEGVVGMVKMQDGVADAVYQG